jgi:hypothetical protein
MASKMASCIFCKIIKGKSINPSSQSSYYQVAGS